MTDRPDRPADHTIIAPAPVLTGHPQAVGKYRIEGILGEGAMGVVYQGHDPDIDRPVAIKTVHAHLIGNSGRDQWLERFAREAKAAGCVLHQNLVTVFDYLQEGGQPYIVMERIEAETLGDRMRRSPRLDWTEAADIMAQVMAGLAAIHDAGIIHRDLKPANVLLTPAGAVKLTDFGVARIQNMEATQAGMIGTPFYMAPEQFYGEAVDARADLFACGVLIYELVTGKRPWEAERMEHLFLKIETEAPIRPSTLVGWVPEALDDIVFKALRSKPQERFESVRALAVEFAALIGGTQPGDAGASRAVGRRPVTGPAGAPPTVAPEMSQTMISRISPESLRRIEAELVDRFGPMGKVLMRRAATASTDVDSMVQRLVEDIGPARVDEALQTSLREQAELSGAGTSLTGSSPAAGQTPPSRVGQDPTDAGAIPPELCAAAAEALTRHLGPIASVLVQREAAKAVSAENLLDTLAGHIASETDRKAFRASFSI